ncbi:Uu.00g088500.m01.CDS01 [Anthostomella pinea]|uniref:Uu.00g088500.m01.CDS01 n=1 Tax=Anthostomella pinea TaxID=933095 RepID=A0AAI8YHP4_9PEZI|nr:Uu.00g088500.m01.CDS01 [Anthostomella pinea]
MSDLQGDRATPASSRQSQTPGAPSRGPGRFRPKNVRRDEAERKRLEDARNRDLASKIKAEEREQRDEERRARRGRGRGGRDRGGLIRRGGAASGPFSAMAAENARGGFGRAAGGHGSGGAGGASSSKGGGNTYSHIRYHPRREHENRINIDLLSGLTDGTAEDGSPLYQPTRYSQKSVGSLPIGLLRTQHEDAEVKVKTSAELEAEDRQSSDDEGNLFVDSPAKDLRDVGMKDDDEFWHAAPASEVKIKPEPGAEPESGDVDMADIPEAQPKAPDSPELKKKVTINEDGFATEVDAEQKKRKEKERKKMDDPEYVQNAADLESILRDLSFGPPVEPEEGQEQDDQRQAKDDQLYLFQLPPILPPLMQSTDDYGGEADTVDLTSTGYGDGAKVKTEEGAESSQPAFHGLPAKGGWVGKLNVRKSGKIEFDWGGTTLNVGLGAESTFLTSAIMAEQNQDMDNPEASTGFACGMGQVVGKFSVTPIWDDEEDWDPSLDDIYGNEESAA